MKRHRNRIKCPVLKIISDAVSNIAQPVKLFVTVAYLTGNTRNLSDHDPEQPEICRSRFS